MTAPDPAAPVRARWCPCDRCGRDNHDLLYPVGADLLCRACRDGATTTTNSPRRGAA